MGIGMRHKGRLIFPSGIHGKETGDNVRTKN